MRKDQLNDFKTSILQKNEVLPIVYFSLSLILQQLTVTHSTVNASGAILAASVVLVIYPDFPLESTGFFQGKHLIHFLVLKTKDFWNLV